MIGASGSDRATVSSPGAEPVAAVAVLTVHLGDQTLDYVLEEVSGIGRLFENVICLRDSISSRRHAEIRRTADGGYEIFDLGSTHGTYVNRKSVQRQVLKEGDEIIIGATLMMFCHKARADLQTRRQSTRVACAIPVKILIGSHTVSTSILDISLCGARLTWNEPVALGIQVTLKISFPRRWRGFVVTARTVHLCDNSLGVVFMDVSESQHKVLAKQLLRVLVGTS